MSASGDVTQMRADVTTRSAQRPPGPDMATEDLAIGPDHIAIRVYRPADHLDAVVVYLHGGGSTIGDLESHDRACRRLAARSRAMVAAVDYRLAPEHPAPAAVDDTIAALEWVAGDPEALGGRPAVTVVAGDSSGGTLAALAALRLRGTGPAPDVMALLYANLDLADVRWFNSLWVPDADRRRGADVSPLAADDLGGHPEAIIVTCELDPLRDQGEELGRRLQAADVTVTVRREPGMVHNFLLWDLASPACAAAGDRVADDIAAAIGLRL